MLDRAEVNVVSGAADVQQSVDPAPHPGRCAVAGVSHLLVPGTIHAGIIEELLLLKLPLGVAKDLHCDHLQALLAESDMNVTMLQRPSDDIFGHMVQYGAIWDPLPPEMGAPACFEIYF